MTERRENNLIYMIVWSTFRAKPNLNPISIKCSQALNPSWARFLGSGSKSRSLRWHLSGMIYDS